MRVLGRRVLGQQVLGSKCWISKCWVSEIRTRPEMRIVAEFTSNPLKIGTSIFSHAPNAKRLAFLPLKSGQCPIK